MGILDKLFSKAKDPQVQQKVKQAAQTQVENRRRRSAPMSGGSMGNGQMYPMGYPGTIPMYDQGVPGDYDGDGIPDNQEYTDPGYDPQDQIQDQVQDDPSADPQADGNYQDDSNPDYSTPDAGTDYGTDQGTSPDSQDYGDSSTYDSGDSTYDSGDSTYDSGSYDSGSFDSGSSDSGSW